MRLTTVVIILFVCQSVFAQTSQYVEMVGHWDKEGLPINIRDARFTEVFGFEFEGEEYGVIGSTLGTHIIQIPEEDNAILTEVSYIEGPQQGVSVIHRDYDVWDHYLYAVGEQGQPRLQIIDFSYLPDSTHVVYDSDSLITNAHSFRIDQTTGRAYACGSTGKPMIILDLNENPEFPTKLLDFELVDYVHDCYVRNDTAWLNCAGQGLFVVDFADINAPLVLGSLGDYPDQGYNHSGWATPDAQLYAFADETEGARMKLCDVSDLSDIRVTDLFNSEGASNAIPHNLMIIGNYIYVSHYFDGLQIFDISNPNSVRRVAWYDTSDGEEICCWGAWGVYPFLPSKKILISDRQNGFYVFRFLEDAVPKPLLPNVNDGSRPAIPRPAEVEMDVFNTAGQLVKSALTKLKSDGFIDVEWKMADLSPGIYIVRYVNEENEQVSKQIVIGR